MASQDWFDKDFYAVLGVSKDVSDADIKKAYRKLARKYHPDSNPGDAAAEAKFKEISEAHSVLADPEQRKEYDAIRAMGSGARFTAPGGGGGAGGFEDVFGGMFGGGRRRPARSTRSASGGGDFDDLLGGLFGSGRFGQTTGGYRGFGGPTQGPRRHGVDDARLRHRHQGRPHHAADVRGHADHGATCPRASPTGRRSACAARATRRPTAASPATSCSPSPCASTRSSSATDSTCGSTCP